MGNRRFSLTTAVLVGLSLAGLYFVGKTVTPPPPTPPQEPKVADAKMGTPAVPDSPEKQKQAADTAQAQNKARNEKMKQMMQASKAVPAANAKVFNPTSIDTDNDYWHHNLDGGKGAQEMRAKVAAAEAKLKGQGSGPRMQKSPAVLPTP